MIRGETQSAWNSKQKSHIIIERFYRLMWNLSACVKFQHYIAMNVSRFQCTLRLYIKLND